MQQRVLIGLGTAGSEDVVLQITPSSSKLQLAPFFRVADGQKPVRLSAASLKRASIQLASGRQSLAQEKTKIEAVKDDAWKNVFNRDSIRSTSLF